MTTQTPVIEKKDNYFSITITEGAEVKVLVDGKEVTAMVMPYDAFLNCYLKRDSAPIHYKI